MFSALSWLKPATYALTFAAGVFFMWLYHSATVSDMRADVARERQEYAEKSQLVAAKAQKEVAKVEQYFYEKMQSGIAAVDAREPERVYIRASCPKLPGADLSGVDAGGRAELDATSRQLVSELRRRIVRLESKLSAWQELAAEKSPH